MGGQDWLTKDFYAALGVAKDADAAAIKKAYRKLARKWHPDQNPGDAKAEAKFKEIGEAYAVLSDDAQRKQYDALRRMAGGGARFSGGPGGPGGAGFEDLFGAMFGGAGAAGGAGAGGPRVRFTSGGSAADAAGFEDILQMFGGRASGFGGGAAGQHTGFSGQGTSSFGTGSPFGAGSPFGGGSPHSRREPAEPTRGADRNARTSLSFRKAVQGATVRMTVDGKSVTARVPAGVKDGQKIRLRGKGRPGANGGEAGDLVITVDVRPDEVWRREGDDLVLDLPVTFSEAALGAEVEVPLFAGGTTTVEVPAGTSSGAELLVMGAGVTRGSHTGDMRVRVQVMVPASLDAAQRVAVAELQAALGPVDPRADLLTKARA
ncbi:DnaJ domain-containing protein [Schaalia sp. 19OD2882]|uniref:DnaJ C-terminal domain-containing protein n=1 Tax=Schaalia sp. 19OD2882 TaxID=2794089 RepID=UPI001C1E98FB|nr:DnaJ C-terminal domain-containing protein [Schaalia sp. 19OD2882]QWW19339.1 DnaJ domain-containing protein [Schaalia sp. 19OD2882]